jgi:hypothetical protein
MTEASAIRRYIAWWNCNAHDRRFRDIMRGRRFPEASLLEADLGRALVEVGEFARNRSGRHPLMSRLGEGFKLVLDAIAPVRAVASTG